MKRPPQFTDEEIRSYMDFEALLEEKNTISRQQRHERNLKYILTGICLITIISLIFFLRSQQANPERSTKDLTASHEPVAPSILDTTDDRSMIPEEKEPAASAKQSPGEQKVRKAIVPKADEVKTPDQTQVTRQPVYVQPEPVAGYPALYEYFEAQLVYPQEAVRDSIEGIIKVAFVIDTTGKAKNIAIENSLGVLFDKEAIRLIEDMPLWKPATYNGKPVESKISLPLTFGIQKISKQ